MFIPDPVHWTRTQTPANHTGEEQKEAIKTLQRTLDSLVLWEHSRGRDSHSGQSTCPPSPMKMDSPILHPLPPIKNFTSMNIVRTLKPQSSYETFDSSLDLPEASITGRHGSATSSNMGDEYTMLKVADVAVPRQHMDVVGSEDRSAHYQGHAQFCMKALDVLRRTSGENTGEDVPDVSRFQLDTEYTDYTDKP
jgi:hypothetical protein